MARQRQTEQSEQHIETHDTSAPTNGDAPPKVVEGKAAKFKRLANRRVPKALKALQYVENLSVRSQYEYTDEQRDRLLAILDESLARIHTAYAGRQQSSSVADVF